MHNEEEKKKSLGKVWKNRKQIWEGILNFLIRNPRIERIARERDKICKTNTCGLYDPKGQKEICYVKGSPCCGGCGCKLSWKQRSLSSTCGLKDVGKYPLWLPVMSEEDEEKFRKETGIKNEI